MKPHKHSALIKAWADGAEVQWFQEHGKVWVDSREPISWNSELKYRIKPQPKLVSLTFDDAEFLIGRVVKAKDGTHLSLITAASDAIVVINSDICTYSTLRDSYTFLDGSPCGKVV